MGGEVGRWGVVREDLNRLRGYVERLDELYVLDGGDLDSMVERLKGGSGYPKGYFHWAVELAAARAEAAGGVEFICLKRLGSYAAGLARRALELYYRIALMDYGLKEALGLGPTNPRPMAYFKAWEAALGLRDVAWEMAAYSGSVLYDVANVAAKAARLEYAVRTLDEVDDYLGLLLEDYLKGVAKDEEVERQVARRLEAGKPPLKIEGLKRLAADVEECLGPSYVLPALQLAQMIYNV